MSESVADRGASDAFRRQGVSGIGDQPPRKEGGGKGEETNAEKSGGLKQLG